MNLSTAPTLDSRLCADGVNPFDIARGSVLRAWRERKRWTVAKVCSILGISSPILRDVEAGDMKNQERVNRLASLYVSTASRSALQFETLAVHGALQLIPGPPGGYDASELRLLARAIARRNQRVAPTPGQTSYRAADAAQSVDAENG